MKLIVAADIHAHDRREFGGYVDGKSIRLQECLDSINWLWTVAVDEGAKHIVILGDLFHDKRYVRASVYCPVWDTIRTHVTAHPDIHLYILVGNHDINDADAALNNVHPLSALCTVVERSLLVEAGNTARLCMVAWSRDKKSITDQINKWTLMKGPTGCRKLLFTHGSVIEAKVGSGVSLSPLIRLDSDTINSFDAVFCGDIHIGQGAGNVHIPGSLLSHDFNDEGEQKHCLVVDVKVNGCSVREVKNPYSPHFLIQDCNDTSDFTDLINALALLKDRQVYGQFHFASSELHDMYARALAKYKFNVRARVTGAVVANVDNAPRIKVNVNSPLSCVEQYVGYSDVTGDEAERLIRLGLSIVGRADVAGEQRLDRSTLRFISLSAENFMSYKSMNLPLDNVGLFFVYGDNVDTESTASNGAGKSAIFDALMWVLYGRTSNGVGGDDVVNNQSKKDCMVTLEFEVDDKEYVVTRFRKHKTGKNNMWLTEVGGTDLSKNNVRDTEQRLLDLIRLPERLFRYAVHFNTASIADFNRWADTDRKSLLDMILPLSVYNNAHQHVKEAIVRFEQEALADVGKLELLTSQVEDCKSELAELAKHIPSHQQNEERLKKIDEAARGCDQVLRGIEKELLPLADVDAEMQAASVEISNHADAYHQFVNERTAILAGFETKVKQIGEQKALFDKDICPVCVQPIGEDHRAACLHTLEQSESEVNHKVKQLNQVMSEASTEYNHQDSELDSKIEALRRSVDRRNNLIFKERKCRETLAGLNGERVTLTGELDRVKEEARSMKEKRKSLDGKRDTIARNKSTRDSVHRDYLFWLKGFSNAGIKSLILDSVVPELNATANKSASLLMDDQASFRFSTQKGLKSGELREAFDVQITMANGVTRYHNLSGGERRRVDLCVASAIHQLVCDRVCITNLLVMDEAFEAVDEVGVDRIRSLLVNMARDVESMFVISHLPEVSSTIGNHIIIRKRDGVSVISR